jgi:hypothetical protein
MFPTISLPPTVFLLTTKDTACPLKNLPVVDLTLEPGDRLLLTALLTVSDPTLLLPATAEHLPPADIETLEEDMSVTWVATKVVAMTVDMTVVVTIVRIVVATIVDMIVEDTTVDTIVAMTAVMVVDTVVDMTVVAMAVLALPQGGEPSTGKRSGSYCPRCPAVDYFFIIFVSHNNCLTYCLFSVALY